MDELCCLHLTGENNGKKDHTVSCMVDQLVREGHCYSFEQFLLCSFFLKSPFPSVHGYRFMELVQTKCTRLQ